MKKPKLLSKPGSKDGSKDDPINAPAHYRAGDTYESIRIIEAWGLGFCDGNVLKYLCRWRTKGGVDDLLKARWYLNRFIQQEEKKEGERRKGKKET